MKPNHVSQIIKQPKIVKHASQQICKISANQATLQINPNIVTYTQMDPLICPLGLEQRRKQWNHKTIIRSKTVDERPGNRAQTFIENQWGICFPWSLNWIWKTQPYTRHLSTDFKEICDPNGSANAFPKKSQRTDLDLMNRIWGR